MRYKRMIFVILVLAIAVMTTAQDLRTITLDDFLSRDVKTIFETTILGESKVLRLHAFSPDSQRLAIYGDRSSSIEVWDIPTASLLYSLPIGDDIVDTMIFNPTGDYFVSVHNDETVYIWDMATGELSRTFTVDFTRVIRAEFMPNSTYMAVTAAKDILTLYNINSGKLAVSVELRATLQDARFSPDGTLLAVLLEDGSVDLYETNTFTLVRTLGANSPTEDFQGARDIQFSASGNSVLIYQHPDAVQIWDITADVPAYTHYTGLAYRTLFLSGNYLRWLPRLVTDDVIEVFNIDTGDVIGRISDLPIFAVPLTFSHDGTVYFAVDVFIDDDPTTPNFYHYLIDVKKGQRIGGANYDMIASFFSPSGEYIMSWNTDGKLYVSGVKS